MHGFMDTHVFINYLDLVLFAKLNEYLVADYNKQKRVKSAAEKTKIRLRCQRYREEHAKDSKEGRLHDSVWQQYLTSVRVLPVHQVRVQHR